MSAARVRELIEESGLVCQMRIVAAGLEVGAQALGDNFVVGLLPIDPLAHECFARRLVDNALEWIETGRMPEAVRHGNDRIN